MSKTIENVVYKALVHHFKNYPVQWPNGELKGSRFDLFVSDLMIDLLPSMREAEIRARIDEMNTYKTNLPDVDSTEAWLETRLQILQAQLATLKGGTNEQDA
jgi:hypothetical protein